MIKNNFNNQQGQIIILATIILFLIMLNTILIVSKALTFKQNSNYTLNELKAIDLAEAGIDKAVATYNKTAGAYTGEAETLLGEGSYSVVVTTKDASTTIIQSTGYIPNKAQAKVRKSVSVQVSRGIGAAFNYGIQVGDGGLEMYQTSRVNGSVYSNGNIRLENNAVITGDAYVAGGIQPSANQENDCASPNCSDYIFGKNISGENRLNVAQSFQPTTSSVLNKVSLKLKKTNSPPDMTIRILGDSSGIPNKNNVLASANLTANLVTGSYGFVDVIFASPPTLSADSVYWIMVDASNASSNDYWVWSADSAQTYTRGNPKWSSNWQAGNPSWTPVTLDLGFRVYLGGVSTWINGANGVTIGGNAHANTLKNLNITGGAYYQISDNITAANYYPNSADPTAQVMPLSESNIQEWKDTAANMGVFGGDISTCPSTLAAGKYIGNITLPGNCTIAVGSPIWVTGNLSMGNFSTIKLDPTFGASSGAFLVDGQITLENGNKIQGSGTSGSYLILVSNFDTKNDPLQRIAVNVTNNNNQGILYSNNGSISIANNNIMTSITAWKLILSNGVIINYDQGLAGAFFSSGPGGAFSVIKGTYQVK